MAGGPRARARQCDLSCQRSACASRSVRRRRTSNLSARLTTPDAVRIEARPGTAVRRPGRPRAAASSAAVPSHSCERSAARVSRLIARSSDGVPVAAMATSTRSASRSQPRAAGLNGLLHARAAKASAPGLTIHSGRAGRDWRPGGMRMSVSTTSGRCSSTCRAGRRARRRAPCLTALTAYAPSVASTALGRSRTRAVHVARCDSSGSQWDAVRLSISRRRNGANVVEKSRVRWPVFLCTRTPPTTG
jgi:hypothetical protein